MRGFMAYLVLKLAGKWINRVSFLEEEFNVANPTIRLKPKYVEPK